jgi:hypothetical protein
MCITTSERETNTTGGRKRGREDAKGGKGTDGSGTGGGSGGTGGGGGVPNLREDFKELDGIISSLFKGGLA